MNTNYSNLKLKQQALNMVRYLVNLSATSKQIQIDELWITEFGSQRRYVFQASPVGVVDVFFRDILILTVKQDRSLLVAPDSLPDALNMLIA